MVSPPLEPVFRRSAQCAVRVIGDETVLVPIRRHAANLESVFVTNEVGKAIWDSLVSPQTIERIVEGIVETFDVTAKEARDDAIGFLNQLVEARLIEEDAGTR